MQFALKYQVHVHIFNDLLRIVIFHICLRNDFNTANILGWSHVAEVSFNIECPVSSLCSIFPFSHRQFLVGEASFPQPERDRSDVGGVHPPGSPPSDGGCAPSSLVFSPSGKARTLRGNVASIRGP